jgi:hypothetical protein
MKTFEFSIDQRGQNVVLTFSDLPWQLTSGEEFMDASFYGKLHPSVNVNYTNRESSVEFTEEHLEISINPQKPLTLPYEVPLVKIPPLEDPIVRVIEDEATRLLIMGMYRMVLSKVRSHYM